MLVVLGAGGRVGQLLRPFWQDGVRAYDRSNLDISNQSALERALDGASAVLSLAGVTRGSDDFMQLNIDLAQKVVNAAQKANAGRVFLMSSAAVYGRQSGILSEDLPPQPVSAYGLSKAKMEEVALNARHPITCLRLGNVAGADAILGGWRTGFELDVLPDGRTPIRSYIGPGTLARILYRLSETPVLPDILNIAAGSIAMGDLLDAAGLFWSARPATKDTIAHVELDTRSLVAIEPISAYEQTPEAMVAQWKETRQ